MGRDRMRVLACGLASIVLIIAGALAMDWYRLAFEPVPGGAVRLAVDLRNLHVCHAGQACVLSPLTPLPGMFPTLAIVTLWSSLGVAAFVAFQASFRIATGSAHDAITKVGYMVALMAISIAVATAYLFGPEREGSLIGAAAQAGVLLQRTWGPLTLIAGLVAGFATLYLAVAPESSDLAAAYKPLGRAMSETRTRTPSVRIPFPEHTGLFNFLDSGAAGTAAGPRPLPERRAIGTTPILFRPRPPSEPSTDTAARPTTDMRSPRARTMAGIQPVRERTAAGSQSIDLRPTAAERTALGSQPLGTIPASGPEPAAIRDANAADEPARAPAADPPPLRERAATGVYAIPAIAMPGPPRHARATTGSPAPRAHTRSGPIREITGSHAARDITGSHAARDITGGDTVRARPGAGPAGRPVTPAIRPLTGQMAPIPRPATGQLAPVARPVTGQIAPVARPATGQTGPIARPPTGPIAPVVPRAKTGPIVGAPPHLRQRLSYVAITAELTAGGIDARREDGLARLVLWRDVVGVVARRLPPVYDGLVFVDVVSTAGSTLRILPWTRLAGEPVTPDAIDRPRALIEHVAARCPAARIDPATRHFLETGTAAQLPDLETLRAHDERLA